MALETAHSESPTAQGQSDAFEIILPKDPVWVAAVRLTTSAVAHRLGVSIDAIDDLKIIVAEACSYCIQYGPAGRLHISFIPEQDSLTIRVTDPEFKEPAGHSDAPASDAFDAEAGLFIIKSLADEVDYRIDSNHGLTLTIRKSLG